MCIMYIYQLFIPGGLSFIQCGLGPAIRTVFLAQGLWRESNVLDNWQLVMLPQSEDRE